MFPYFLMPLVLYVLSSFESAYRVEKYSKYLLMLICALIIVAINGFAISRGDAAAYENMYNDPFSAEFVESGYLLVIKIFRVILDLPYTAFLIFLAMVNVVCKCFFFDKMSPLPLFSICLYLLSTFVPQEMGAMRFSLGISIYLIGLVQLNKGKWLQFLLILYLASLFHTSALIGILALLVWKYPVPVKYMGIGLIISFVLYVVKVDIFSIVAGFAKLIAPGWGSKMAQYQLISPRALLELGIIRRILFLVFILVVYKRIKFMNPLMLNVYFLSIIVYFLFASVNLVAQRFSIYFACVEPVIVAFIIVSFVRWQRFFVLSGIFIIYAFGLYKSLNSYSDSTNLWVPYKTIMEEN